jgi:2-hydroxychromene-2-carboxylate isomerase
MGGIALFFDYLSPYAYLAWADLSRRASEGGHALTLEPVLLAGLLAHHGQLGPAEIPAKRAWLARDVLRRAQRLELPLTFPATHPFRPLTALRVSLREVAGPLQARVVDTLFRHGWQRGGDLGDDASIIESLCDAGLDGRALVAKTEDDAIKACLRERTEHAIGRGVFGVPTLLAGDELFWGSDRVDDALDHLEGRLQVDPAQVAAILARPGIRRSR